MDTSKSQQLFSAAQQLFPGGVNSPVRAFRAVGGQPLFIDRGQGAYLYDVDGNGFVDFVLSWGPLILGHSHPAVVAAITETALRGTSFGAPSELEIKLGRLIQAFMPNLEMLRFVNSGTEATMTALRLARAYTGRSKIVKFEGCYHGHADMLLVKAGSGVATLGLPDSPGVPAASAGDTLVVSFNDIPALEMLFNQKGHEIAAVIVEPVAGNMGVVPPEPGFLESLRRLTTECGALLIFDEVMTGFRVHLGGAQALYGIQPDLTTLGKVIGGGLPVGAYGGRKDIMQMVAPSGPMYQAGTLSGNPLTMAAGIATLEELRNPEIWNNIAHTTTRLGNEVCAAAKDAGIKVVVQQVGTMFTTFFTDLPVKDWSSAKLADTSKYAEFFRLMLEEGVYLAPSQFEAGFLSSVHGNIEIEKSINAIKIAFHHLAKG
ncbi:MAG TPA: glutamate-1-semialdehyde 2,1-aminomutase [Bellilinea sp.]|jgi:glutamate-1-semialdehyde 2,1-aminomutase|nr:glutamate-1-semialdehyde 2,1-aminomutase [Anaerolineae bacterium]HML39382.1 glutamate-1-semialdehyde 2,1-aminomutase [Bellilinea sp.]